MPDRFCRRGLVEHRCDRIQPNWAVEGLCEHLEAVAEGRNPEAVGEFPAKVFEDAGDVGVLPGLDLGAARTIRGDGTAGPIYLRQSTATAEPSITPPCAGG